MLFRFSGTDEIGDLLRQALSDSLDRGKLLRPDQFLQVARQRSDDAGSIMVSPALEGIFAEEFHQRPHLFEYLCDPGLRHGNVYHSMRQDSRASPWPMASMSPRSPA